MFCSIFIFLLKIKNLKWSLIVNANPFILSLIGFSSVACFKTMNLISGVGNFAMIYVLYGVAICAFGVLLGRCKKCADAHHYSPFAAISGLVCALAYQLVDVVFFIQPNEFAGG